MTTSTKPIQVYRRELKDAIGDRNKLSTLHSSITELINSSYGEEKELLIQFRKEVKDALNCRLPGPW